MTSAQHAYIWLQGIIGSCETYFHFKSADILIELFGLQFPDEKEMKIMLTDLKEDKYKDYKREKIKAKA